MQTTNLRSSPETEAAVLDLYDQGLPWREIAAQSGVTRTTVSNILKRNGRSLDRKPESARSKALEIITLHRKGVSNREIGRRLGHSQSTISAIIAQVADEPKSRTGVLGCENPDFFESVDTAEKAYWLGFISADGCIATTPEFPEGSYLSMGLAVRDREHLVKLREALGAPLAVHVYTQPGTPDGRYKPRDYTTLSVYSRRLVRSLRALGVTPRKSKTLEPWDGPADLMPHYWRGMIDGDGSIAIKGNGLHTVFLCGSEATVRAFAAWAAHVCGTEAQPYAHSGCWYLAVSGKHQVPTLLRVLYGGNAVSLDRKQQRADQVLAAEEPRRKPGPPRMEFPSEEERVKHFRAQKAAAQRRYMERKREAPTAT